MTAPRPDLPRPRCADVADAAGDPLAGSAAPAQEWFLVEHPGPWHRSVLADPQLDRAAVDALGRWSRARTGRVLFVRRPQRAARGAPGKDGRRWFRIDSRPGHESIRTGLFGSERELVDVVADPGAGAADDGPLYLVCTHGRHDTCCAVRGRPLAAAVAAEQPGRTWEASHVGGCRFAAAMVLLPHGVVLGHVPAAEGPAAAADYAGGVLPVEWVRGRTSLAPAVQAAQHHARTATGALGVDALVPLDVRTVGPGSWRVAFAAPAVTVVVNERRVEAGRPLTCAATTLGWMRVFDLVDLVVEAPVSS